MLDLFPHVIDSSMLSTFRACPRKFELMYLYHWKPGAESTDLLAGGAFASGIEAARRAFFEQSLNREEAAIAGIRALWKHYGTFEPPAHKSNKSAERMGGALLYYLEAYPLGADGATPRRFGSRHGIEFSFVEPVPDTLHPVTGDPILYSGRADQIAEAYGGIMLYDEKTTSQLGPTWSSKWDMRSQFTAYCWGVRGHGINATGVVVRGIAILKDSYNCAQAITYRSQWEVDRWLEQVREDLDSIRRMLERGRFSYNLDDSCTAYGGCAFLRVCKSPDPDSWLPMYFHKRKWDPVNRTETEVV